MRVYAEWVLQDGLSPLVSNFVAKLADHKHLVDANKKEGEEAGSASDE